MPNRIHPTAVVGDGVELGDGNVIGPYAVILGPCRIGSDNWIGPHATIGTPAEDRGGPHPAGWEGEQAGAGVVIGDRNKIREFVSVHQGTKRPTTVGDDCYLLATSHLGHDAIVENEVTLTSMVQLGGHAHVWSYANVGMNTAVHQHTVIGPGAMVGMGSAVRREVGPFTITVGNPARTVGVNEVGLRRRGCDEATVAALAPFVKGAGELPDGLPDELVTLLKRWIDRAPAES